MSHGEFSDRAVIVTGSSAGIGLATALLFARHGANLVLVGRRREPLQAAVRRIADDHGARAECVVGNVADAATADAAVAQALQAFGRLDVLANVAGAFPTALLGDITDALYQETISANLTGTFHMCRAAAAALCDGEGGAIVNVSSTAARLPTPGLSVYSAAKAGIEAFSRAIAAELAPLVRVNTVAAGPTLTETVAALMASDQTGAVATVTQALPLKRLAQPSEIAEAILFLASPRASVITGQVLYANCGGHMA